MNAIHRFSRKQPPLRIYVYVAARWLREAWFRLHSLLHPIRDGDLPF